ncbi:hypothetical protein [Sporosarcina sp. ITBMC105]
MTDRITVFQTASLTIKMIQHELSDIAAIYRMKTCVKTKDIF